MVGIRIDQNRCKGCDLCLKMCPERVFEETQKIGGKGFKLREPVNTEDCSRCGLCQYFCPEEAIVLEGASLLDRFWQEAQEIKKRARNQID